MNFIIDYILVRVCSQHGTVIQTYYTSIKRIKLVCVIVPCSQAKVLFRRCPYNIHKILKNIWEGIFLLKC